MLTSFEIANEAQRQMVDVSGDAAWAHSATFYFHWGVDPAFCVQLPGYHAVFRFYEKDLYLTLDQFVTRYLRPTAITLDERRGRAAA